MSEDQRPGVIEAVSRYCKTMADGTLRLTVDISPIHAHDAFYLFGMPDIPMAIARLTQAAALESAQKEAAGPGKVTGLALLAVQWCKDEDFHAWILDEYEILVGGEEAAADWVRSTCEIESRRELETNQAAAAIFNREIRGPFMLWLEKSKK